MENIMNAAAIAMYVMDGDKATNFRKLGFKPVDEANLRPGQFCIIAETGEELLATAQYVAQNEYQAIFSHYTKAEHGLEYAVHIEIPKNWVLVYPVEEVEE